MNPYYEQKILNSEPIELVRLVYQTAIASVRDAREHLREKRIRERSAAIMRAYAAIAELVASLRPEAAPELCGRLRSLYAFMLQRLLDANAQQADPPLAEVLGLLSTLAEAWTEVAHRLEAKPEPADDPKPVADSKIASWRSPGYAQSVASGYSIGA